MNLRDRTSDSMLWLKMDGFFPLTNNMKNIYYRYVKGSSYRQEKKPTRIPSIRSKDPVPGQISCQQDLYPGYHAGGKGLFYYPGENSFLSKLIKSSEANTMNSIKVTIILLRLTALPYPRPLNMQQDFETLLRNAAIRLLGFFQNYS